MNYLEIIKNISLFLASAIVFIGLLIIYIKVYRNVRKIKKLNEKIEEKYMELDENEINRIKGLNEIDLDFDGSKERYKTSLKQQIKKWQREKSYLLEEISIYKIFKK